ncbi:ras GEF [Aaosphaeria arxii CBS 175.79]|uniref:Ras GEF n=1 Tax=Aaosphaeria arxii CBS 175.79 TaxID=1450172 RepID=A0A6A5XWP1_9PLEO|nr:ras GEF [Aaosphaeria arxii CBS 175.79]KAF2017060.1 ras GEF [Aaosphaeria arxii CBS 175.79]
MPTNGRAASSAGQTPKSPRPATSEHSTKRSEKARSAQSMQPPRRESSSLHSAVASAQRPGALKNRAYSAPMIPKNRHDGGDDDHMADMLAGEACDEDEIAADPFFQRYNFPQSDIPHQQQDASSSSVDSSSDTEGPLSPTHVKGRQPTAAEYSQNSPQSPSGGGSDTATAMHDINIAVIGARGTGKSVFTQRALNLQHPPSSPISTRKMTIDGGYYVVRFLEMNFTDVHVDDRNDIKWPETIDSLATPRIDGAVIIYDVTSRESLTRVPEMLNTLSKTSLPFVLVACKCDHHPAHREVHPETIEQKAKSFLGDINTFQTSEDKPETQRGCLSVITRAVIAAKRPRSQASMARRRANSSAVRSITAKDQWAARKHERASSEFSVSRYRPRSSEVKGHSYKSSETPGHTFLDLEESPGYDSYDSDGQASDTEQSIISEQPSPENGYTFDQLVDRLLSQPMSKHDSKFVAIFLALYRRFAAPSQLLEAILKRFEALKRDKNPQVIRIISQLRYLAVLQQWISHYPGDFAFTSTRRAIRKFTQGLASNREFAVAAKEIMQDLEMVMEDDDTDWACCDRQRSQAEQIPNFRNNVLDEDSEDDEFSRAIGHMSMTSDRFSIAQSTRTNVTGTSRTTESSVSSTILNQVERNENLAKLLIPNPIKPLSKIQWHLLIAESEEAIAKELTRIDWIMFSSIRPRDLVRHVSMNLEEKRKCKSLENVNRMIDHFNHVAYLVTNYILLRDKPKHRAMMLEKWMKVARAVRQLNNYNALGAVLAGIKGTAVHRLSATRELVSEKAGLDYLKLELLMSTDKSHFSYRLAWENSSGERIPYIPLHRRDLVSASEGNSTFVGDKKPSPAFTPHPGVSVFQGAPGNRDSREAPPGGVTGKERINWRKFEIMGEVIVGVQRAQGTPFPAMSKNEDIRALILDIKILKDDDELYERSTQLEAAGASERRRIFDWFRER